MKKTLERLQTKAAQEALAIVAAATLELHLKEKPKNPLAYFYPNNWYTRARRLYCSKCGVVIKDSEDLEATFRPDYGGEFWHPKLRKVGNKTIENTCPNAGKYFEWGAPDGKERQAKGLRKFYPKSYLRARKRGSKLAKKMRPR